MLSTANAFSNSATQEVPIHTPSNSKDNGKESEDENNDKKSKDKLKKDCRKITVDVFDLLSSAVDQRIITNKDRNDYMEALSDKNLEAGGASTWEEKEKWLKGNLEKFAPKFIAEAKQLSDEFIRNIESAKSNGWITVQRADYWINWVHTHSSNWPRKRKFLKITSKKYMANWQKLAEKRDDIRNKANRLKVSEKEIPELKKIQDPEFENLKYKKRMMIVNNILTQLALFEDQNSKNIQLHKKVKEMLEREVKLGVMRKDQSAMWLESLFNRKRSTKEIESIIKGKLTEYVGQWAKLRYRFDRINRRMQKKVPQGANKISEKEFLNMKFEEKKSYIQETEYTLDLVEKGASKRPIDKMKLEIRSLIAQKDWEGARAVLKEAEAIAEGEDIFELESMSRNIEIFGEEEEEFPGETASELLENLRDIIMSEVPSGIRTLYIKALSAGPQVFASLSTLLYNRIWCWNNGHLNGQIEEDLYYSSVGETIDIVKNGHREEGRENINMSMIGGESSVQAIRPYDEAYAPTLVHIDASDGSACSKLVGELKSKSQPRDYWTSLIVHNISFEKQSALTKGVNQRIKSGIRKLHRMGVGFSITGTPPSVN